MKAEKMYITKQEEFHAIKLLLAKYDHEFKDSKDWIQSDTLGKVDWLIGMCISTKQEVDMVWGWLLKINEPTALLDAAKANVQKRERERDEAMKELSVLKAKMKEEE